MTEFFLNSNIQFYIIAYLVGGIPFGLILAKFYAGVNIKEAGSKNIGATNVLRVVKEQNPALAKKLAALTLGLDAIKGLVVLLVAQWIGLNDATLYAIAVLAVVGHCFSPYLWFEGGKGVATGFGVLLVLFPVESLIGLATWAFFAKALKISSLSSLGGLVALVIATFFVSPDTTHVPVLLIAFFITYKHIPNIVRLIKGEEKAFK